MKKSKAMKNSKLEQEAKSIQEAKSEEVSNLEKEYKSNIAYVCNRCGKVILKSEVKWVYPYGSTRGYREVNCPECHATLDWFDSTD